MDARTDPAEWSLVSADSLVVGHDYGFSVDHSTAVVAGRWTSQGVTIVGIPQVVQWPLRTPPATVQAELAEIIQGLPEHRLGLLAVDSRSNISYWHQLVLGRICPTVGVSNTAAEYHSLEPAAHQVPVPGSEQPIPAFEFKLSRNQLMDDLAARMSADRQSLYITQEADAGALMDELTGLKREVTAARNVRYTTPAGGHDDLVMALAYALWALDRLASIEPLVRPRMRPATRGRRFTGQPAVGVAGWT